MFLAVWLVYATDRLLDTNNLNDHRPAYELQPRHRFPRKHLVPFASAMVLAALALAALVPTLPATLLTPYLFLAALLALWFAFIHLTPFTLPKEFVPGLFFAAAVFLPSRNAEIASPILFAALCTLNCLYIHSWEHPQLSPVSASHVHHLQNSLTVLGGSPASRVPHPHDSSTVVRVGLGRRPTAPAQSPTATDHLAPPQPNPATTLALHHLPHLTLAVALLPLAHHSPITIAISLSAVSLLALNHYRHHLSPTHLRAAADLALLTPILILAFLP